jgi:hypothetical protein
MNWAAEWNSDLGFCEHLKFANSLISSRFSFGQIGQFFIVSKFANYWGILPRAPTDM